MNTKKIIKVDFSHLKGITPLHRVNPNTNKKDGDVYAYMCKHCGSIWKVGNLPCHEPVCRNFQLPLDNR
jgi:hypothetical protein